MSRHYSLYISTCCKSLYCCLTDNYSTIFWSKEILPFVLCDATSPDDRIVPRFLIVPENTVDGMRKIDKELSIMDCIKRYAKNIADNSNKLFTNSSVNIMALVECETIKKNTRYE